MRRVLRVLRIDGLGARLLGAFVLVSVVPLMVAGVLAYRSGEGTLRAELWERLDTVTQLRTQQIHAWLDARQQDIAGLAALRDVRRAVGEVAAGARGGAAADELREVLEQARVSGGFAEVFLLSAADGTVLVSTDRGEERKLKRDRPYFSDGRAGSAAHHVYYSLALGRPVLACAAPVRGSRESPVAILVGRAELGYLDQLLDQRAGLGVTGRSVLVNRFNGLVSTSQAPGPDGVPRPLSEGARRALAGETGTAVYRTPDGRTVVGAYRPIARLGLALIAEMDADEAFTPITRFRIVIVVLLLAVCGTAGLLALRLAWGISRPIKHLARAAAAIGDGDLEHRVTPAGPHEIRALARAFNGMAQDLARSRTELVAHSAALEAKVTERTRNLTAVLEVSQAIGSTLDVNETLWSAARSLVRVLRAEAGVAYVLDEGGRMLQPVAGYQLPPMLRGHTDRVSITLADHAFIADACASHQATFADNAPADSRVDRDLLELWGFRCLLFVPMYCRGRLVGGLFAGWGESRAPLTHEDLNLLDGIGRQAGIAVQNAALFADSERRRHAAEMLAEVDAVLAGSLDRGVVADAIVRGARALVEAPVALLHWLDAPSGDFHVLAVDGLARDALPGVIPRGHGICGVAVEQRAVIASADVLVDPRVALTPELRRRIGASGWAAMLAAPLRMGEGVIGVLSVADGRGRGFTADDSRLLRTFASQAALALENARLYDEAQARAARLTRLGEFGRMISSSLNLREVLDRVAGAARELVDGDLAGVWVADTEREVVRLMALQDRTGAALCGTLTELPLGVGVVGYVMTDRRRHYSPDMAAEPFDADDWLKVAGYTSRLAVPLIVNDRPVGVLTLLTRALRRFSREEEEIVELFASEAATAVENARLFADTEAQAEALVKKNAELDAFTYSVSHDLKAPLVTIQAMCGMVLEDQGERLDEEGRRVMKRIEANAMHMSQLISDLLALSRIGREARDPEAVPIREVIETVLDRHHETIRARGVEIVCTADVTVWGIRVHLEQVFANIVGNAVKYLGATPEPRVEIHAEDDGRFVQFSVRDNGIGIDPAYHTRIFELFQRLRDVEAEGTGVGLALVKKIVDTVGGRIWVESTPGHGATFRFTWPVSAPVRAA